MVMNSLESAMNYWTRKHFSFDNSSSAWSCSAEKIDRVDRKTDRSARVQLGEALRSTQPTICANVTAEWIISHSREDQHPRRNSGWQRWTLASTRKRPKIEGAHDSPPAGFQSNLPSLSSVRPPGGEMEEARYLPFSTELHPSLWKADRNFPRPQSWERRIASQ